MQPFISGVAAACMGPGVKLSFEASADGSCLTTTLRVGELRAQHRTKDTRVMLDEAEGREVGMDLNAEIGPSAPGEKYEDLFENTSGEDPALAMTAEDPLPSDKE